MAWSQWLHKAYAEYDRAEAARKRRVNPDYPNSPGTGGGYTSGQRAKMATLKAAMLAAVSNNPDDNAEYTPAATVTINSTQDGALPNIFTYTAHPDKITLAGGEPVKSASLELWFAKSSNASPAMGALNGITGNAGDNTWSNWLQVVEFETDAPTFQIRFDANGMSASAASLLPVRCVVDGKFLSKAGHGGFFSPFYYKVAGLPDGAWKRVRVEGRGGFARIMIANGYSIRAVQAPSLKGATEGDSYSEPQTTRYGDGSVLANGAVSWASNAVRKLGWGTSRPVAVGLTGYITAGGRRKISERIADWANYEPLDYVFVAAGFNDGNGNYAAVRADALSAWQQIRAAQPNALIIVMGVWPINSGRYPDEDNVKVAYDAWGDKFSLFIPMGRAVPPWTYTLDIDAVHPSNVGHQELGAQTVTSVSSAVAALAALMGV